MNPEKVVIAGGSGMIGREITALLVAEGAEVVWLSSSGNRDVPEGVHLEFWDPTGKTPLNPQILSATEGVTGVIQLAGARVDQRWTTGAKRAIRDSRVISTRVLVNAMKALPLDERPAAFIGGSAIGFYGTGETIYDEQGHPGEGFLSEVVAEWEAEESRAVALGIRVAIVRTGLVLSKRGGMFGRLLPIYRLGLGSPVGSGEQWQSWVHISDLAQMFVHLLRDSEAHGIYNGVAPTGSAVRQSQFSSTLAKSMNRPHFMPRVPRWALQLVFGDMAETICASQHIVPARLENSGFVWKYAHLSNALTALLNK